jgi:hypothetical protein
LDIKLDVVAGVEVAVGGSAVGFSVAVLVGIAVGGSAVGEAILVAVADGSGAGVDGQAVPAWHNTTSSIQTLPVALARLKLSMAAVVVAGAVKV